MPRPRKWRKVCCLPENSRFGPLSMQCSALPPVVMTVEEYETIRLIDLEGMTQEQCAEKMHVARTTIQSIYALARNKIADSLVNAKVLLIDGGDYRLCDGGGTRCGGGGCRRHRHGRSADSGSENIEERFPCS